MSEIAKKPKKMQKPWTDRLRPCPKATALLNKELAKLETDDRVMDHKVFSNLLNSGSPDEMLAVLAHPKFKSSFIDWKDFRAWEPIDERMVSLYGQSPEEWNALLGRYHQIRRSSSPFKLGLIKQRVKRFAASQTDLGLSQGYLDEVVAIGQVPEIMGAYITGARVIDPTRVKEILETQGILAAGGKILLAANWSDDQKQAYAKECWQTIKEYYHAKPEARFNIGQLAQVVIAASKRPETWPALIWKELPVVIKIRYSKETHRSLGRGLEEIIQNLPMGDLDKWQAIYEALKERPKNATIILENRNVPVELGRQILEERPSLEVRLAIAKNKSLRTDKQIRQKLEVGGRTKEVWRQMIASSTDPEEGARLLGHLANVDLYEVRCLIANNSLPPGILVPNEILKRLLLTEQRDHRVSIYGRLGELERSKEPLAPLPARGKVVRTKKI